MHFARCFRFFYLVSTSTTSGFTLNKMHGLTMRSVCVITFLLKICARFLACFTYGVKLFNAGFTTIHFENRSTIYSYINFGLKNSSFQLRYQCPSSSADCARELFKGSNGSASLGDGTRKTFFGWGVRIFCD